MNGKIIIFDDRIYGYFIRDCFICKMIKRVYLYNYIFLFNYCFIYVYIYFFK